VTLHNRHYAIKIIKTVLPGLLALVFHKEDETHTWNEWRI